MSWHYCIRLFIDTHCVARGLRARTLAAYEATLWQFHQWARLRCNERPCGQISPREVLEYLQHLRTDRLNGDSAINRHVTILRSFYVALVAMGHLPHTANPMAGFPTVKAAPRKLPVCLSPEQVQRLLDRPDCTTLIGLRDRALLALLYGTGIRASECAALRCGQVDLHNLTVFVRGKGGHERCIPLNPALAEILRTYERVRGASLPGAPFLRARGGQALSRTSIYERVRLWAQRAALGVPLSPHRLRHTFASHLVRAGVGLVTIRDLLGHRLITSTQIYLHVTAEDLRSAASKHPIGQLLRCVQHLLPDTALPFRAPSLRRASG